MQWEYRNVKEAKKRVEEFSVKHSLTEEQSRRLLDGLLSVMKPSTLTLIRFFETLNYPKHSGIIRALRNERGEEYV